MREGTMRLQTSGRYPINCWALRAQDALLVAAFGLWSSVLGLSSVLVIHVMAAQIF